jgi:hypothetical protein
MLATSASVTTDNLSHYPHVPLYYILSRSVTPEQEESVHTAIVITPIYFSIITNLLDAPLAYRFGTSVLTAADDAAARALAQQIYDTAEGHPNRSIIIGTADILTAVYQDREETIPCS